MNKSKTCEVPGCDKRAKGRHYCSMHLERLRKHGSLEKPATTPRGKQRPDFEAKHPDTCTVEGCDRASHLRGYCHTHYRRWRTDGVAGGLIEPRQSAAGNQCAVDECEREARQRGWCNAHYQQWRLKGVEPGGTVRSGLADVVGYSGVHERLRRIYGPAPMHACVDCGSQANDWSYDNQDPDELVANGTRYYSLSLDHYAPRCRWCHARYDRLFGRKLIGPIDGRVADYRVRTHCLHGHEYNEANTYIRRNGSLVCRVCRREAMRHCRPTAAAS